MLKSEIKYHRERAEYWRVIAMLHKSNGRTGRARNARRLYNEHLKELLREVKKQDARQLSLIP